MAFSADDLKSTLAVRFRAAAVHCVVSALIVGGFFALIYFVVYPAPTLTATGGDGIMLLLACVDVVVGPLLTFLVFDSRKKTLAFDLSVIAALQLAAFLYGAAHLLEARPVYVAALDDGFQAVLASEVADINLEKAKESLPWFGPRWVGTKEPEAAVDRTAVEDLRRLNYGAGHLPQLHIPLPASEGRLRTKAVAMTSVEKFDPALAMQMRNWLIDKGVAGDASLYSLLPVKIAASTYVVFMAPDGQTVRQLSPFLFPKLP